jgi:hypothetical protein
MLGAFKIEIIEEDVYANDKDKDENDIFSEGRKEDADLHYDAIEYGCCGDNLPLPQFDDNGVSMSQRDN